MPVAKIIPVPESPMECGLPTALSYNVNVAARAPTPVGTNQTLTVQTPPVGMDPLSQS